jgi:hypothetical protein
MKQHEAILLLLHKAKQDQIEAAFEGLPTRGSDDFHCWFMTPSSGSPMDRREFR